MQIHPAAAITSAGRHYRQGQFNDIDGEVWLANRSGVLLTRLYEATRTHVPADGIDNRWLVQGENEAGDIETWLVYQDRGCGCGGTSDVDATQEQLALLSAPV